MVHNMKLQPKYYDFIINGTKRIEIRLNDEKRRLIKVGDIIEFKKEPELNESFKVKVTDLIKYNSFKEMFNDFDTSLLASKDTTKEELLNTLEKFYPEEKQREYGVLCIKFELL